MSFPKLSWGREKHDLADRWPKGPDGTPEKPAFLASYGGLNGNLKHLAGNYFP